MKKIWYILLSVFILIFVIITIQKDRGPNRIAQPDSKLDHQKQLQLSNFWTLYQEATAFRMNGEWAKAITKYKEALVINPDHEDAIYYLGNMYLESGRHQEAEEAWLRLIQLNTNSARAHYQLGHLYMNFDSDMLFDLDKAETEFEKTLNINKDFIQPLIHLGQISLYKGDLARSNKYFSTVLGSDPQSIESNLFLGYILWKQGDRSRALTFFTKAQKYSHLEDIPKGVSNEGDTEGGKSMERLINQPLLHSYLTELLGMSVNNLTDEMEFLYRRLDQFLAK